MSDLEKDPPESEQPEALADPVIEEKSVPETGSVQPRSVARSAGIVSIAVMFSRVLGLVRETVFARFFGAGYLYDAFVVAFKIPNILRDLFAEGALSAAFVKVFTDYQIRRTEIEAWQLASLVFNVLAVVMSAITIIGILIAPWVVPLLARGFEPEKAALAVTLTQIMFPFILLVALAALAMGVLNTKARFGIPASASTAFNIFSITTGIFFAYWLSGGTWEISNDKTVIPSVAAQWAIIGMAIGTLVGGAAQLLIQVPSLLKVGFRFSPVLKFSDPGVKRVMRLMGPALIGTSAVQIKVLVDVFIVSGIEGAQSWLSYSFRLMQFPIGVFGVAIGTAAIPTLSRLASEDNIAKFRDTLADAMKLVFLMTIPAASGLIVLGEPIVALIYQGGAFRAFDTNMVAWALAAYSVGLAGYAAIKVLSPSFYALDDARTPMYVSLASVLVHAPTSYGMMTLLSNIGVTPERSNGFGHVGVALATSVVALVNFTALTIFMRRRIRRLNGREIFEGFLRVAAASAVMSAVCFFSYRLLHSYFAEHNLMVRFIEAFIPIALGGITFLIMAKLLHISEIEQLSAIIRRKFAR
ncbi:murein biosynthesis integral membrane protein MurJ [Leptolyngbya sp. 7M]|uniref:murein biosynthesis integral membrane protein MurJ n=1 Tax=Leptolyngbya sp. 7M TaxID=2812896 RepID=UPI001B8B4D22|nr:murein biosynthesis integral membrane protein MurJ [Leptolyngbya sp. 7M]QYO66722.1 murein biosynthesis integral membrane protein MurJ [Leptolyngbya sp. 7M]